MKFALRAATAFAGVALATSAFAADLPRRMAPPPVFTPVPVFTWTGFYAGFNAGYGFAVDDFDGTRTILNVPASTGLFTDRVTGLPRDSRVRFFNHSGSGFTGGGQIGYNYQFTPGSGVVVGIEADAQYADFGADRSYRRDFSLGARRADGTTFFNPNGVSQIDFFGTVRGRIGYAFDRVLFYGTGGFAYASNSDKINAGGVDKDDFMTGYVGGAGVEYALPTDSFLNFFRASAITLKAEALYVNLDHKGRTGGAFATDASGNLFTLNTPGVTVTSGPVNREVEFVTVRGGVNYKFGSY